MSTASVSIEAPSTATGEVLHTDVDIVTSPVRLSNSPVKSSSEVAPDSSDFWTSRLVTFTVTLVFAVGTGNVWNIPAMCAKHGGGVFLIQFAICLTFAATPLLLLEISLGQFTSRSPFTVFRNLVPVMTGLIGSFCFILVLRYVTSSIWAAHHFALLSATFEGIFNDLPWKGCDQKHHGVNSTCYDYRLAANCTFAPPTLPFCSQFQHALVATRDTLVRRTPFIHYVSNTVFKVPSVISSSITAPYWPSFFCLILIWPFSSLVALYGRRLIPKVSTTVCCIAVIVYTGLFISGFFLDNSFDGVQFLYQKDLFSSFISLDSWSDAAAQAVTSLNLACGGIIMLSSLRPFNNCRIYLDSLAISASALIFYTVTTITAFLYVGSFSAEVYPHLKPDNRIRLIVQGEKYIQAIIPEILSDFKGGWLWTSIFFITEFLLASNTMIICLWVVFCLFADRAVVLSLPSKSCLYIEIPIVVAGLILSTVLMMPGGFGALFVLDDITAYTTLVLALLQLITVAYLYGFRKFTVDIRSMMSQFTSSNAYWWIGWMIIAPLLILACILTGVLALFLNPLPFHWSLVLFSWLVVVCSVLFVPVMAIILIYKMIHTKGSSFKTLLRPTSEWRPLLEADKTRTIALERALRVR